MDLGGQKAQRTTHDIANKGVSGCEVLSPASTSLTVDTNAVNKPLLAIPRERYGQVGKMTIYIDFNSLIKVIILFLY
jgi:hypothetical protein